MWGFKISSNLFLLKYLINVKNENLVLYRRVYLELTHFTERVLKVGLLRRINLLIDNRRQGTRLLFLRDYKLTNNIIYYIITYYP